MQVKSCADAVPFSVVQVQCCAVTVLCKCNGFQVQCCACAVLCRYSNVLVKYCADAVL